MFVTSCSTVQVFFLEKSNLWFVCKLFHLQKTEVLCIIFPDLCSIVIFEREFSLSTLTFHFFIYSFIHFFIYDVKNEQTIFGG